MTSVTAPAVRTGGSARSKRLLSWLGVVPFFLFALLFLILPTINLFVGAFQSADGHFSLDNIVALFAQETIRDSYIISLKVSAYSSILGALVGFFLAYAVIGGGLPAWLRPTLMTFSGVASNFAGLPLAFAFISTLGRIGLVTIILASFGDRIGIDLNIYHAGFKLLSLWGLTLTYMYFQIPLMVLVITPALDGMKKEWREASANLGASNLQYWLYVAIPVLWPSVLGSTLLLFANAFGAIATAYALTGSSLNIVPIQLYAEIQGDVLHNPNLGYAMAFGMVVITGISNVIYLILRAYGERWVK
ncbi:ABC transporter permease [Methylovirgula sp. 4M-Z18]|uniref:ABC transporter permease n=1 Tax=Methylovirgula sp. 4M-Z18 TaxID=2293567 RepID=UPI000E2F95CB|nr:ABC transporter permease subunit [Methylovirgula sp. 4M-Z18]RFB79209.1 acriflavin resistance protein [Methylovirgula sp. 4M-Z18]